MDDKQDNLPASYNLPLECTDGDTPPISDTANVKIDVSDVETPSEGSQVDENIAEVVGDATSMMQTAGVLDHETQSSYDLPLECTDDDTPPISDTANVDIDVSDVD